MQCVMGFLSSLTKARPQKVVRPALSNFYFQDPAFVETHAVETIAGRVRGFQATNGAPLVFRGVPFATARRFQNPQPVEPWQDELSCLRFGPACPQSPIGYRAARETASASSLGRLFSSSGPSQDDNYYGPMSEEDCLNLNVYTPSPDGKRPVLVWIHGGSFVMGSNIDAGALEASKLAEKSGAVVVCINYRLGPLGFLHFPEERISNLGIRDQIAALEWVRDNIASFGGDPANVTIIGQQSGGSSVGTLMGSPLAQGLFAKAIPISGGTLSTHSPRQWDHMFVLLKESLTSQLGGAELTSESLGKVPIDMLTHWITQTLIKSPIRELGTSALCWQPYRDGVVVPEGGAHKTLQSVTHSGEVPPVLTGHMSNEFSSAENLKLATPLNKNAAIKAIVPFLRARFHWTTRDDLAGGVERWTEHATTIFEIIESGKASRKEPTNPEAVVLSAANILQFEDSIFCLARDTKTYAYCLDWDNGSTGVDVELLFHFRGEAGKDCATAKGSGRPLEKLDEKRADQYMDAIMSFVHNGVPKVKKTNWRPFPEILHMKKRPFTSRFKQEIFAFQDVKTMIAKDMGIDTLLPQNATSLGAAP